MFWYTLHRKVLERPLRTPRSAERLVCPSLFIRSKSDNSITSKTRRILQDLNIFFLYNLYSTTTEKKTFFPIHNTTTTTKTFVFKHKHEQQVWILYFITRRLYTIIYATKYTVYKQENQRLFCWDDFSNRSVRTVVLWTLVKKNKNCISRSLHFFFGSFRSVEK